MHFLHVFIHQCKLFPNYSCAHHFRRRKLLRKNFGRVLAKIRIGSSQKIVKNKPDRRLANKVTLYEMMYSSSVTNKRVRNVTNRYIKLLFSNHDKYLWVYVLHSQLIICIYNCYNTIFYSVRSFVLKNVLVRCPVVIKKYTGCFRKTLYLINPRARRERKKNTATIMF